MSEPDLADVKEGSFSVKRNGGQVFYTLLNPQGKSLEWIEGMRVADQLFDIDIDTTYNDPGVGRVEVVGQAGQLEHEFLQVLDIFYPGKTKPAKIRSKKTKEGTEIKFPGGEILLLREAGAQLR